MSVKSPWTSCIVNIIIFFFCWGSKYLIAFVLRSNIYSLQLTCMIVTGCSPSGNSRPIRCSSHSAFRRGFANCSASSPLFTNVITRGAGASGPRSVTSALSSFANSELGDMPSGMITNLQMSTQVKNREVFPKLHYYIFPDTLIVEILVWQWNMIFGVICEMFRLKPTPVLPFSKLN